MPGARPAAPSYAALLRGINLGGRHKVGMADLRQVFSDLGFSSVATYIQSGNVVFTSPLGDVAAVTAAIERELVATFGFDVPIVLRSAEQLAVVASNNPFLNVGMDVVALSVGFLAGVPDPARVSALLDEPFANPAAAGGDEFSLAGQEVYLHHPNGYGRTKLTNTYFDRRLGTMMTVRNWRTVMALLDMTGGTGLTSG